MNNRGTAYILLIALLPVLLITAYGMLFLKAWLRPEQSALHICRAELLRTLDNAKIDIVKILNLNNKILETRKARAHADALLKAALLTLNPELIATAKAALMVIISYQKGLHILQNSFVLQGNLNLNRNISQSRNKVQDSLEQIRKQYYGVYELESKFSPVFPKQLAVRQIPSVDPGPPIYELKQPFFEQQALHISWSIEISHTKAGGSTWNNQIIKKQDTCGASLDGKIESLTPVLSTDKSLSRFYSF
jgi:hypothetical protein